MLNVFEGYTVIARLNDLNGKQVGILFLFLVKRRKEAEAIAVKCPLTAIIIFPKLLLWLKQKVHKLLMWYILCSIINKLKMSNKVCILQLVLKRVRVCSLHHQVTPSFECIMVIHDVIFQ